MVTNIVENKHNKKDNKIGQKRFFNQRFINEQTFA